VIRVVIDTNVLVSALLTSGGLPEAVIDLAISGEVRWVASESILAEYEDVLKRPRLASNSGKAANAIARIRAAVFVVSTGITRRSGQRPSR
jgi:putative PIN family toxin of toxin-antitoxin system